MIEVTRGDSPLILGLPHTGTDVPADCAERLNDTGRALADTDWHIEKLYAGLVEGATLVRTPIHRYVIDVNRAPSDESLYPGQNTTGLCPVTDFDGRAIYLAGRAPDATEIARRTAAYHAPYHGALAAEIARIKALHGFAILYDCHSIRSNIPFLFEGTLPDFNIGTNSGATCDPAIEAMVHTRARAAKGYSSVLNGRFKGGWTTRHYGRPSGGIHAIQMELAQSTHISQTPPWAIDRPRFDGMRAHLRAILTDLQNWRPQ
jgi:N-formylglutamate deformylase